MRIGARIYFARLCAPALLDRHILLVTWRAGRLRRKMHHGRWAYLASSGVRHVIGGLAVSLSSSLIGGGVTAWGYFPFALRADAAFSPILRPLCRSCRSVQGEGQSPARRGALDGCRAIRSGLGAVGFGWPLVLTIRPDDTGGSSREAPEGQGRRPQSRSERDSGPGQPPCGCFSRFVARPLGALERYS